YLALDWTARASLIAGTALSTTSLAVVYAVLVERGLTDTSIGKLLMSATFVTDLCTSLALSGIFIKPNIWFPVFLIVSVVLVVALPRIAPWFFSRYGNRVIEPEIKLVFACLLILMVLGRRVQRPRGAPCLRARPRHEPALPGAPRRAEATAGRGVRVPDAVLLHQGRAECLARRRGLAPPPAGGAGGRKDGPEGGTDLPARPPRRQAPRRLRHAADEHRPHVRHHLVAVRPQRRHHRQDPVLAPGHGRGHLSRRPHSDRRTVVPARLRT